MNETLTHFADHETLTLSQLVQLTNGKLSTLKLRFEGTRPAPPPVTERPGARGTLCEANACVDSHRQTPLLA
jgi:hypothetical protein